MIRASAVACPRHAPGRTGWRSGNCEWSVFGSSTTFTKKGSYPKSAKADRGSEVLLQRMPALLPLGRSGRSAGPRVLLWPGPRNPAATGRFGLRIGGKAREAGERVKPMAQAMGINGCLAEAREAGERGRSGRTVSVESGESVAMRFGPKGPLLPAKIAAAAGNFRPLRGLFGCLVAWPHGSRHGLQSFARFAG